MGRRKKPSSTASQRKRDKSEFAKQWGESGRRGMFYIPSLEAPPVTAAQIRNVRPASANHPTP